MKKIIYLTVIILFTTVNLKAQDLKSNIYYQQTLNYLLVVHARLYAIGTTINISEREGKIETALPSIEKLLKCSRASFELAAITDEQIKADTEQWITVMEQCATACQKTDESPTWKMPEYIVFLRIEEQILKFCN